VTERNATRRDATRHDGMNRVLVGRGGPKNCGQNNARDLSNSGFETESATRLVCNTTTSTQVDHKLQANHSTAHGPLFLPKSTNPP